MRRALGPNYWNFWNCVSTSFVSIYSKTRHTGFQINSCWKKCRLPISAAPLNRAVPHQSAARPVQANIIQAKKVHFIILCFIVSENAGNNCTFNTVDLQEYAKKSSSPKLLEFLELNKHLFYGHTLSRRGEFTQRLERAAWALGTRRRFCCKKLLTRVVMSGKGVITRGKKVPNQVQYIFRLTNCAHDIT